MMEAAEARRRKRNAKERRRGVDAKLKIQECFNIEKKSIPQASTRSKKFRIDPTLRNFIISTKRIPFSTVETVNSPKMGDKHLDTQKGSLESSVKDPIPILGESDLVLEDLVPTPSESADLSDGESECDVPINDDSPESHFSTFDNPLFDSNDDFSSDDESLSEEEIPKEEFKIFSNPLYDIDDEIITNENNLLSKKDLDEIIPIPPGIDEQEIDLFLDNSIHNRVLDNDDDSEGDILPLEELLDNVLSPLLESDDFIVDVEPVAAMMNDFDVLNNDEPFDPGGGFLKIMKTRACFQSSNHPVFDLLLIMEILNLDHVKGLKTAQKQELSGSITSSNTRNQAIVQDGKVVVQNVQGRQNRGRGNNARGTGAAGYGGAQNRVRNANTGQARQIKCYNCNAQENGVALDEEQLLFIAGGQDNAVDEDVDEQPVHDLALNVDNVFQDDDFPVYDEAGPSYDSDILSEVHEYDNYQDAVCEHHEAHEMHHDVQLNCVVDSNADYTSDSNMIMYDQYVKDNAEPVVQSNVSSVPNDAYMMVINEMHEQSAQIVSAIKQNNVVNASLTAELATYKEQVELYERRAKFELTEREQKIEEQLRIVITDRNIKEENLKKELHSVKMQLNSTINHNKSMVEEVTSLKRILNRKKTNTLKNFWT
ncbi:hypothetical protein Tco_0649506 [Tanacetum coccineum]